MGIPIIRIKVYQGLYKGPPVLGNYHPFPNTTYCIIPGIFGAASKVERKYSAWGLRLTKGIPCKGKGFIGAQGLPKMRIPVLGGPLNKDFKVLVSILGSPYLWQAPDVASEDTKVCMRLYRES